MLSYFLINSATISISPKKGISNHTSLHESLVYEEEKLRRKAYSRTPILTDESFFNNSDLHSDYFLIVVYCKRTKQALLSARYYFDKAVIGKSLKGMSNSDNNLDMNKYRDNEVFLIDRMSANLSSKIYRKHRSYIHRLFYSELLRRTKECKCIAMARKEKREKLLARYHRLGLNIVGSITHKNKAHWVLFGDMKELYKQMKKTTRQNNLLLLKHFFKF